MLKVIIDYPTIEDEKLIVRENLQDKMPEVKSIVSANDIFDARKIVEEVYLDDKILQYIADVVLQHVILSVINYQI